MLCQVKQALYATKWTYMTEFQPPGPLPPISLPRAPAFSPTYSLFLWFLFPSPASGPRQSRNCQKAFVLICGFAAFASPFLSPFYTAYDPVPGLTADGPGGCRKQGARGWLCTRKKDPKYGFTYLRSLFYPFFASKTVHFVA